LAGGFFAFLLAFSLSKSPASAAEAATKEHTIAKRTRRETDGGKINLMSFAGRPVPESGGGKE
jgi:hypothetical protein